VTLAILGMFALKTWLRRGDRIDGDRDGGQ
jgi:hypothetical protein